MYREMGELPQTSRCPLCGGIAFTDTGFLSPPFTATLVICPSCGKFRINSDAEHYLARLAAKNDQRRYKLSYITRRRAEGALGKRDNSFFPVYSAADLEKMLDERDPTVEEKMQRLLTYLGNLSEYPGQSVDFNSAEDYTVLAARNAREANFYAAALEQKGLLQVVNAGTSKLKCSLSANGWTELDRIAASGAESTNAFIAMWFDSSRSAFETAINEAIANAGYIPIRIDRLEHLNRIDDEIIARIRGSKFLIADFTGQRNGVYFEAGFMLGLGRPVIWVCDKGDMGNVHFDTRQYNTIDYLDSDDLKTRLQFRIEANLGKGPHAQTQAAHGA